MLKWIVAHYDCLEDEDRLDFVEQFLDDKGGVGGDSSDAAVEWVTERLTMCVLEHKELLDCILEDVDWVWIQRWAFGVQGKLEEAAYAAARANCG